jgi:uncharacterized membrane protein
MNNTKSVMSCLGIGAGLMYFLDPAAGRRRRALVRDKVIRGWNKAGNAIEATACDLSNRARGLMAEARSFVSCGAVLDEVLVERVRSKIGRVVSHPSAIEVTADQGRVTLRGPVLGKEVGNLLSTISSVRGVVDVENRLEAHKQAGDVPGLQGGAPREQRFELMQTNWSPTARLLMSSAGGTMTLYGFKRGDTVGIAMGALGAGVLARAIANVETRRLLGLGGGRRAVDINKTINIATPVEDVFQFWTNYQNFPRFMSNVREVRDLGGGRSHWVVAGPASVPIEWDAVVTELIPNQVLAWKNEPGSPIQHAGIIHFRSNYAGSTSVNIHMSYHPPAGAVGHAVASLFGTDPKRAMDEDLMRMKSMIETGVPPHDAAEKKSAMEETYTQSFWR